MGRSLKTLVYASLAAAALSAAIPAGASLYKPTVELKLPPTGFKVAAPVVIARNYTPRAYSCRLDLYFYRHTADGVREVHPDIYKVRLNNERRRPHWFLVLKSGDSARTAMAVRFANGGTYSMRARLRCLTGGSNKATVSVATKKFTV